MAWDPATPPPAACNGHTRGGNPKRGCLLSSHIERLGNPGSTNPCCNLSTSAHVSVAPAISAQKPLPTYPPGGGSTLPLKSHQSFLGDWHERVGWPCWPVAEIATLASDCRTMTHPGAWSAAGPCNHTHTGLAPHRRAQRTRSRLPRSSTTSQCTATPVGARTCTARR